MAIYGSWAARYEGVAGRPPNDVDALVIGEVSRRDIYEAAEHAEQRLGLPVNPVLCSVARWFAAADSRADVYQYLSDAALGFHSLPEALNSDVTDATLPVLTTPS